MTYLTLHEKWKNLPEKFRFIIVGGCGVAIGWVIYNLIYILLPDIDSRATIAWILGYFVAVIRQHGLHYWLTFTNSADPYLRSLLSAFAAYSVGGVLTTLLNYFLNETMGLHYQLAWAISVGSSVGINYVLLSRFAFGTRKEEQYNDTESI